MNLLSIYTLLYGRLYCKRLPYWVLSPVRRLVRMMANIQIPSYLKQNSYKSHYTEKDLILSLTSFPARIDNVWKVVECLKRQSLLPEKIILWLSKDQFPVENDIPLSLQSLKDSLFEIRFVEGDIRSHKKYYYTLLEYPEKTFITCDDDVFYDPDMIRRLVDASRLFPGCIIANHTCQIVFDADGEVSPYVKFPDGVKPYSFDNLMQIGIGGVLYPPHCLHELVLNKDIFLKLTPLADDIWLNGMARLNGTEIVQSSHDFLALPIEDHSPCLSDVNNGMNRNDEQISNMRDYLRAHGLKDVYKNS